MSSTWDMKEGDDPEYWELKREAAMEREQSEDRRRAPWDRELEDADDVDQ